MGVITITQRRESLGNLGSTGMAHGATSTDIGRVHHTTPGTYSPRYFAPNSHGGDGALGNAVRGLENLAVAIGQREDERQCDKIVIETMKNVDIMDRDDREMTAETVGDSPERKHLVGQRRGCLLRTGEGTKGLPGEADGLFLDTFANVCAAFDATDRQRGLAAMRLAGYRRNRLNRMLDLQAGEYRRMEIGGAEGQLTQFITAWKNGNSGVVGDIFRAQEKLGILKLRTPEQRKADSEGLAVALGKDLALSQIAGCRSESDYDGLEKLMRDDMEKALPEELVAELPGKKMDAQTKKDLVATVLREKAQFVRRRELAEMKAVDETLNPGRLAVLAAGDMNADNPGARLSTVDGVIANAQKQAETLPKTSRARLALAEGIDRLNRDADAEAERIVTNAVLAGETADWKGMGSRFAKAVPLAKAKADRIRHAEESNAMAKNDRDLRYDEMMLDYEIQSGMRTDDEIAKMKRDLCDRQEALAKGRLISPEDAASFAKRWSARKERDESAAAVEFDRAFGLTLRDFVDAKGDISTEVTDAGYKKAVKSGQKAVFPGTDEKVSLGEYLKMRASFLERLRALPANADRRQETSKLLEEFRGGWYSRQAEANIEALARTMNDIHLGIEADVEAERLKAAAEEQKRNMTVVGSNRPANAEPQPDLLEFYRQANPLDATIKYR